MPRGLTTLTTVFLLALAPWLWAPASAAPATLEAQVAVDGSQEPAPVARDLKGLRRDTWYFLGYQFVVIGVLYAMPTSVTNWERDGEHLQKWWDNVTHPTWDEDDFYLNYILHPYWGATYYVRGRERGLGRWESFGYSTLLSTLYEFGAEALFERPSYQDLIVTPVLGSLLGEFVFAPVRDRIKAKAGPLDRTDKLLLVLTDPLGVVNEWTDRLLGVQTQVSLAPFRGPAPYRGHLRPRSGAFQATDPRAGPWFEPSRPRGPTWGLQLEVRW